MVYSLYKRIPLLDLDAGHLGIVLCADVEEMQVGGRLRELFRDPVLGDAEHSSFVFNIGDELLPRPYRKVFYRRLVHVDFSLKLNADNRIVFKRRYQFLLKLRNIAFYVFFCFYLPGGGMVD